MVIYVKNFLEFILDKIIISERHAARSQFLRAVDGSPNNLQPGQLDFGAQETVFPRLSDPVFRDAEALPFDPDGPQLLEPFNVDKLGGRGIVSQRI